MLILSDRVKQTSITPGTGNIVLNDTIGGFQSFSDGIGDGNATYYTIENGTNYEVGVGTYSNNILSRDLILDSSNNDQRINLNGASIVFCTYPAKRAFFLNDLGYASGQSPHYSGIAFPNGLIQYGPINGSGTTNHIPYWSDSTTLSSNNGLTWDNALYTLNVSGAAIFDSDVIVRGDFNVFGTQTIINTDISNTQIEQSTLSDITFRRTQAGCFYHAYVDNNYDSTVALYSTNEQYPTWRLGLKDFSPSFISSPTYGYVAGKNGSAGIYATDQNFSLINYSNGFWVRHRNIDIFNVSKLAGIYVYNQTASEPAFTIRGAAAQSANLQEWENYSSTIVASVSAAGQIYCQSLKFSDNSVQSKAYTENYRNLSSSANILITDDIVFIRSESSNIVLTMPTAVNNGGKKITIKHKGGDNIVTISAQNGQNIDNNQNFILQYNYQAITLISDNSNWYVI